MATKANSKSNSNSNSATDSNKAAPASTVAKPAADVRNGVKARTRGTRCGDVWDYCDAYYAQHGRVASVQEVREEAQKRQAAGDATVNVNNWQIECYQWRKYHGVSGRVAMVQRTEQATASK